MSRTVLLRLFCWVGFLWFGTISRPALAGSQICSWIDDWNSDRSDAAFGGLAETDLRGLEALAESCGLSSLVGDYRRAQQSVLMGRWLGLTFAGGFTAGTVALGTQCIGGDPGCFPREPSILEPGRFDRAWRAREVGLVVGGAASAITWAVVRVLTRSDREDRANLISSANLDLKKQFQSFQKTAGSEHQLVSSSWRTCSTDARDELAKEQSEACTRFIDAMVTASERKKIGSVEVVEAESNPIPWLAEWSDKLDKATALRAFSYQRHMSFELEQSMAKCASVSPNTEITYADYQAERLQALNSAIGACERQASLYQEYTGWVQSNTSDISNLPGFEEQSSVISNTFRPRPELVVALSDMRTTVQEGLAEKEEQERKVREQERKAQARREQQELATYKTRAGEYAASKVRNSLRSPSTASVQYQVCDMGMSSSAYIYGVYVRVDAQNAFGAYLRHEDLVKIKLQKSNPDLGGATHLGLSEMSIISYIEDCDRVANGQLSRGWLPFGF